MPLNKFLITFLIFILLGQFAKAQDDRTEVAKKVSKIIRENLNLNKIKDSIAVYSTVLNIKVKKGQKQDDDTVEFELSNKTVAAFFNNLAQLNKLDYKSILKREKKNKLFFKIYILVMSSKHVPQVIDIKSVEAMLDETSIDGEVNMINLGTIRFKVDKTIYH